METDGTVAPMNFTLPYSHEAALSQLPVLYHANAVILPLYPMTLKAVLEMDQWLRQEYLRQYEGRVIMLPESERKEFVSSMLETIEKMTFQHGPGQQFLFTNFDAVVRLVRYLCRNRVKEQKIRDVIFSGGLTDKAIKMLMEMCQAVYRPINCPPTSNWCS